MDIYVSAYVYKYFIKTNTQDLLLKANFYT